MHGQEPKPYCEGCKKKVTIHLTEIIDGKVTEMHLCEACPLLKNLQMEKQFGLSDLLAGLADFGKQVKPEDQGVVRCDNCELTYDDFKKFGRLGCSECYESFRSQLSNLLKKIHGSSQHLGKKPVGVTTGTKKTVSLADLKNDLTAAISAEDFEKAAHLRDKIRALESEKDEVD